MANVNLKNINYVCLTCENQFSIDEREQSFNFSFNHGTRCPKCGSKNVVRLDNPPRR